MPPFGQHADRYEWRPFDHSGCSSLSLLLLFDLGWDAARLWKLLNSS
jgi:hypothetical protein